MRKKNIFRRVLSFTLAILMVITNFISLPNGVNNEVKAATAYVREVPTGVGTIVINVHSATDPNMVSFPIDESGNGFKATGSDDILHCMDISTVFTEGERRKVDYQEHFNLSDADYKKIGASVYYIDNLQTSINKHELHRTNYWVNWKHLLGDRESYSPSNTVLRNRRISAANPAVQKILVDAKNYAEANYREFNVTGYVYVDGKSQTVGIVKPSKVPQDESLILRKVPANKSITDLVGNNAYSLAGAVYEVYGNITNARNRTNPIATLTTNAQGKTNAVRVTKNTTYWIREKTAPKGYLLDDKIHEVRVGESPVEFSVDEQPKLDPVRIMLSKVGDNNRGLPNAEFEAKLYNGIITQESGTPIRTWKFKTGSDGRIQYKDSHKISGPDLIKDSDGNPNLPIGTTLVFRETKAPEGYNLDNRPIFASITDSGAQVTEGGTVYNAPTVQNAQQKGRIAIRKVDADTNAPIQNAVFEVKLVNSLIAGSTTQPGVKATLRTNAQGRAETGDLELGVYEIRETSAPSGYLGLTKSYTVRVEADNAGQAVTTKHVLVNGDNNFVQSGTSYTVQNAQQKGRIVLNKVDVFSIKIICKNHM